jgi:hypothetical protein|tara:strand:+ start:518 stop:1063 length:546 start_codon:yes stop_codon:yes gene_type:complete
MPNWCNNTITIRGAVESLSELKDVVDSGEGLLQAICPMPKELEGTTAPSDAPNWYDWCITNWGTKWDPELHLEYVDNGDGTAEITGWFDTAWSPPIEALNSLADDWDSCYIELFYEEGGMAFVGYWDSEGADDHYAYDGATSDTIRNMIPEYLVDHFALDEMLASMEEDEEDLTDLSPNIA